VATLVALCSSLLKKPLRGGLVIIGEINLGGSIEPVHNAVTLVEMAVEKGAQAVLMPVASRRQSLPLRHFDGRPPRRVVTCRSNRRALELLLPAFP
jgi:predicted ATP-dependent Lon-type protease